MKYSDLITITIPVWERIDYFLDAIASALEQSVPVKVIVVDNGSSHSQFENIIKDLNNPAVSYFRNEKNIGMYGNWNRCADLVETPFFSILGDDDNMEPNFVEEVLKAIRAYPEIDCVYTDIHRFGDWTSEDPLATFPVGLISGEELLKSAAVYGLNFPTNAMVLKKNLFSDFRFLETAPALNQDWLFVYQALATKKVFGIKRKLINYRINNQGNAVKVGMRASLSTAFIYDEIAKNLDIVGEAYHAKLARDRSKWVPRNAIIAGGQDVINEMTALNNQFSNFLKKLIATDQLLKESLLTGFNGYMASKIIHIMRFLRRFQM